MYLAGVAGQIATPPYVIDPDGEQYFPRPGRTSTPSLSHLDRTVRYIG